MFKKGQLPILGIMRGIRHEDIKPLADLCIKRGLSYIEITMNTDDAPGLITEMIRISQGRINVGAGTVLNLSDLEKALNAGANFIVSPSVVDEVIKKCANQNIPVL